MITLILLFFCLINRLKSIQILAIRTITYISLFLFLEYFIVTLKIY